jgi:hypothetical protein
MRGGSGARTLAMRWPRRDGMGTGASASPSPPSPSRPNMPDPTAHAAPVAVSSRLWTRPATACARQRTRTTRCMRTHAHEARMKPHSRPRTVRPRAVRPRTVRPRAVRPRTVRPRTVSMHKWEGCAHPPATHHSWEVTRADPPLSSPHDGNVERRGGGVGALPAQPVQKGQGAISQTSTPCLGARVTQTPRVAGTTAVTASPSACCSSTDKGRKGWEGST